ncbi:MAG: ABC transporter ATP-binding protein, partial [Arsenicicoccus sp.]
HVCDRVAVMQAGEVVEVGPTERLFAEPEHTYTRSLVAAIPDLQAALAGRSARELARAVQERDA